MNVFVTGGSGFIGSHLCAELKRKHWVVALVRDELPSKWLSEALDGCVKVRGDIKDLHFLRRVLNEYEIEQVYHLAAQSIVKTAYRDPIGTFDTNIMGTVILLEACRQIGVKKTLYLSSDKVYGNQMNVSVSSPLIPTEPYATSKICADLIAQNFAKTYEMNIVVVRLCNVYGYDPNNRIIPNTIRACLRNENPIIYKGDTSYRQYIYVNDAILALTFLMENNSTEGVYCIGTNNILTQEEVVKTILKFFPHLEPHYVEKPKLKEIHSQSMTATSWSPYGKTQISFEKGIKLTIEKFKQYLEDWK